MALWILSSLFASAVLAHSGVKSIFVDGNTYHPFESRIDHLLGPVKRIEWSHDLVVTAFNPITNLSDPNIACRENARPPLLKAPVRAGAEVGIYWTALTRMHTGPTIAYLGRLPTPDTPPQQVKFFKIWEKGFDASLDAWGNQIAADNGDSYKFQLPSDIKPGTYVLRTELIALHGNMDELRQKNIRGEIQVYPHCFNLEILGSGTAEPAGVSFPGAYSASEAGFKFNPFMTHGFNATGATEHNSKYVPPGPPVYKGKYDAPTGQRPVVAYGDTGAYPPDLEVRYQDLIRKLERPGMKLATFINTAWRGYVVDGDVMKRYGDVAKAGIIESREVMKSLKADIEAFKKDSQQK